MREADAGCLGPPILDATSGVDGKALLGDPGCLTGDAPTLVNLLTPAGDSDPAFAATPARGRTGKLATAARFVVGGADEVDSC